VLKILLNAGNSFEIAYVLFLIANALITYVKIAMSASLCCGASIAAVGGKRKSAGVSTSNYNYNGILASQRLHAGDLVFAYLVGFIEGDGYFTVTKNGLYVKYELGIELSIKDVKLIYKIKKLLGVGIVSFRTRKDGTEMVSLRVRNKDHLKKIIVPIFDKYPLFSNKQYDYLFFRECLFSDLIYSKDLLSLNYQRQLEPSLNSIDSILNSSYFDAWLVGFIEAEGCFSVYNTKKEIAEYLAASFDISQTNGEILISAIRKYLGFTTKIYIDKTNCSKLKVSGIRSISNIIKFLDKAPVKLQGNKKLQYLLWLKQLRKISRYSNKINIPNNY